MRAREETRRPTVARYPMRLAKLPDLAVAAYMAKAPWKALSWALAY